MVHATGTVSHAIPDFFAPTRVSMGSDLLSSVARDPASGSDFLRTFESALRFDSRSDYGARTANPPSTDDGRRVEDRSADTRPAGASPGADTARSRDSDTSDRINQDRPSDRSDEASERRVEEGRRDESRTEPEQTEEDHRKAGDADDGTRISARDDESESEVVRKRPAAETAAESVAYAAAEARAKERAAGNASTDEASTDEAESADSSDEEDGKRVKAAGRRAGTYGATHGPDTAASASHVDVPAIHAVVGEVRQQRGDTDSDAEDRPSMRRVVSLRDRFDADENEGGHTVGTKRRSGGAAERVVSPEGDTDEDEEAAGTGVRRTPEGTDGARRTRLDIRDLRADQAQEKPAEGSGVKVETDPSVVHRRSEGIDGPGRTGAGERAEFSPGRALREQLQPELVRHARLVVRGESSGDIRLVLRPEQLGRVRISLHLEDNRIAGRIIVENGSVRDAFQANVHALERALRDAGLETAGLEVTVGEGDSQQQSPQHSQSRRRAAHGFEEMVPQLTGWYDDSDRVSLYA